MVPHIAVILTDPSRKIIWVNDDFTSITGYDFIEVVGKKPSLLQGPKSEPEAIQRIRKGLEEQVSVSDQITNYRKNGEAYQCRLVIHPIFGTEGALNNRRELPPDRAQIMKELEAERSESAKLITNKVGNNQIIR